MHPRFSPQAVGAARVDAKLQFFGLNSQTSSPPVNSQNGAPKANLLGSTLRESSLLPAVTSHGIVVIGMRLTPYETERADLTSGPL